MANGSSASSQALFSPLPESGTPWTEFVLSFGTQTLVIAFMLWVRLLNPEILRPPENTYRAIQLVPTPAPLNHDPQPVRQLQKPVEVAEAIPAPTALRLPAAVPKLKREEAPTAPEVHIAPKKLDSLPPSPVIPKQLVRTNIFSTGSSATPTIAKAPQQVQTGGFGDPNGIPARPNDGKPANIAQSGGFDMPTGPGYGNGTGGASGARGVVASAGFGAGVSIGNSNGKVSGTVHQAGFGDADAPAPAPARSHAAEAAARMTAAEILSKPTPIYTEEARRLRIEGEVLLEVVLEASGRVQVTRVVRGLGHGLDEAAVRAAQQIHFKPALRNGEPADSTAVLHIIFQLA